MPKPLNTAKTNVVFLDEKHSINPATIYMEFVASDLVHLLKSAGMSRLELAIKLGCDKNRVNQILSGDENLTIKTITSVVEALGRSFTINFNNNDDSLTSQPSHKTSPTQPKDQTMDTKPNRPNASIFCHNLRKEDGSRVPLKHLMIIGGNGTLGKTCPIVDDYNDTGHISVKVDNDIVSVSLGDLVTVNEPIANLSFCELVLIDEIESLNVFDAGEVVLGARPDYIEDLPNQINKTPILINDATVQINGIVLLVHGMGYRLADGSYQKPTLTCKPLSEGDLKGELPTMIKLTDDIQTQLITDIMTAHFLRVSRLEPTMRDLILDYINKNHSKTPDAFDRGLTQTKNLYASQVSALVDLLWNDPEMHHLNKQDIRALVQIVLSNYDYYTTLYRGAGI